MSEPDPVELLTEATRFYTSGQLGKALTVVDEALKQASAQKHGVLVGAMIQKAGWLREAGQAAQASEVLSAAEEELQKRAPGGGGFEWSSLRLEQAHLAQLRGDLTAAESLLTKAEALARESKAADIQLPDVYANQASLYLDQGRIGEAQDVLFKALEIDRRIGNHRSVANDLNMLGLVYKQLGDTETARAYFEQSFGVASENGLMKEAVDAMSNLATLVDDSGEHAQAAELFATANRFYVDMRFGSDVACSVSNEGVAALRLNDHARARELLTRAHELHLEAGNQSHAIYDLVNLSNLEVLTGDGERALSLASAGLASARQNGMVDLQWKLELVVAELRVSLAKVDQTGEKGVEQFQEALEGLGRAADIIELLRTRVDRPEEREWFLVDKERVYEDAIALCAALGKPKDVFRYCERGRARAFLDAIGAARIERIEEDDPRRERRSELVSQLLDPAVTPDAKPGLLDELRMLRAQSAAERPAISAVTDAELPSFEEVCAAIPEDTRVLELFQTGENVFHLLLDRTGLLDAGMTVFEEPVETVAARFRQEVIDGDPDLPTGHSLFVALFRPVMPKLAETARLIVVPHRSLHYIPWSALWFVPAGDDAPPRQYLRSRFLLGTVPSASYLAQRSRSPSPDQGDGVRMVLGDPTGDLEGAAEEAREVAKTLRVQPLLGPAATKDALLQGAPSAVLHVAAHGSYNPEDPLLSGLHMADGLATVEDMLTRAPRTRLLVLSGCVTGLSERRPGDELIGLARAALLSGTKSIVVTLWETSDEASMSFFRYFYDALSDGSTVSEAIAWSQHHLATGEDGYDQPVDWAPFLLLGDPDQRLVDPDQTPRAMFDRGATLSESGDVDGAIVAFQAAAGSGSSEVAPRAAFALGVLLNNRGDAQGALAAWRQAGESGDPEVAPLANYSAGGLLEDQGDIELARTAYELATRSDHPTAAPLAANNLGRVLAQQGDVEGARAAFQRAIDSNHSEAAPKAANNLGALLSRAGDVEGARAAYQRAVDTADSELAPYAALNLASMLAEHGDVEGARSAYQRAIDSNHPDAAPVAANDLGTLLSQAGDVEGARAAYQRAIETGGPELSPLASLSLGILLARHSDIKGARAALEVAIHSDHRQASQWGSYYLGVLLTEQRDAKGALAAFQAAVDGDDAEASRLAANAMASLGKRQS